jgi:hypothetical protein
MTTMTKFTSISQIKEANADAGHFYFSPHTMRFFRSRVSSELFGPAGSVFITSEKNEGMGYEFPRGYTVRRINDDATIAQVSEFQQFSTVA